jgi:antitoxin component of MazEF toxin-antitoxin module
MVKKLVKHGNSLALILDKPILDLLRIDADTNLSVSTDGKSLFVSPVTQASRQRKLRAAMDEMHQRYGKMLKRLAE